MENTIYLDYKHKHKKFRSLPLQFELGSPAPVLEPLKFVSGECSSNTKPWEKHWGRKIQLYARNWHFEKLLTEKVGVLRHDFWGFRCQNDIGNCEILCLVFEGLCVQKTCCWLTLIWPIQNDVKKPTKWLKTWYMGTHLRVLRESYPMNTIMIGFRWFSKVIASLCFGR